MGTNKALLPVDGVPMIERIATVLRSVFEDVCISANDTELYRFLGLPVVADGFPGYGPLAGIHAVLAHAKKERVFIVSCDMPGVTEELIRLLVTESSKAVITIASDGKRIMPLCGVYHKSLLPAVESWLSRKKRRVTDFLATQDVQEVHISSELPWYRPGILINVNEWEEYEHI